MDEPFNVSPERLRWLTWPMIFGVYFYPRDEHGKLKADGDAATGEEATEEELFKASFLNRGSTPAQCDKLWNEWVYQQGQKYHEGVARGALAKDGTVRNEEANAELEERWLLAWRAAAQRIMTHGT